LIVKGSCLCGSIIDEIDGELGDLGHCHCKSCRKASGSGYGANVGVETSRFRLSDPWSMAREFESSPGKLRMFCSNCGSPIYAYLRETPQIVRIRLGSLDSDFDTRTKAHTFVADKAKWESISDDVPQFDG